MQTSVLEFLGNVYPHVSPLAFYKVVDMNGAIFRDGFDFRMIENFQSFASQEEMWRQNFLAMRQTQLWADQIISRLGRPLCLDDIRLAFRPSGQPYAAAFVDDVKQLDEAHLLVETSQENWQAHFRLSRSCTAQEVLLIHRYLSKRYHGDTGAHAADQARRLPRLPLRTILQDRVDLSVDEILKHSPKSVVAKTRVNKQPLSLDHQILHDIWARKLDHAQGDKSSADFKMAIYLLGKGSSFEETCEVLTLVSAELFARKGQWCDDYIARTVLKADQLLNS